jgi:hypothetical protein
MLKLSRSIPFCNVSPAPDLPYIKRTIELLKVVTEKMVMERDGGVDAYITVNGGWLAKWRGLIKNGGGD